MKWFILCFLFLIIPIKTNGIHDNQRDESTVWDKRVKQIGSKAKILISDVHLMAVTNKKCTSILNMVMKNGRVVTGLPLFNLESNQQQIRSSFRKTVKYCKK